MSKSKFHQHYIAEAAQFSYLGASLEVLAAHFDVCVDTIQNWRKQHPAFERALSLGRTKLDNNVAKSLYKRAIGYEYKETKLEHKAVPHTDDETGEVEYTMHVVGKTETIKQVAADVTAATFWLKTRQPDLWREVQHVEHNGLDSLLDEINNTSRGLPSAHPHTEEDTQH